MMDAEDIAAFRADVAQYPGVPLADIRGLRDDPDEPTAKAYLMEVACERLLRLRLLDLCKSIVASEILNVPDSWYRFGSEGIAQLPGLQCLWRSWCNRRGDFVWPIRNTATP